MRNFTSTCFSVRFHSCIFLLISLSKPFHVKTLTNDSLSFFYAYWKCQLHSQKDWNNLNKNKANTYIYIYEMHLHVSLLVMQLNVQFPNLKRVSVLLNEHIGCSNILYIYILNRKWKLMSSDWSAMKQNFIFLFCRCLFLKFNSITQVETELKGKGVFWHTVFYHDFKKISVCVCACIGIKNVNNTR